MKKLKVSLLALCAFAFLALPSAAQVNPQFGPIAGQPYNYVPASNTPMYFTLVYTDPTQGSTCYNPVVALFNAQSQTGWACVIANAGTVQSQGTWQVMFGPAGLNAGTQTLASAATLAPTSEIVVLTGTTAVTSITVPSHLKVGAKVVFITNSATTSDFPAGNNITGTGTGITTVAGQALQFVYDGTNFHYVL